MNYIHSHWAANSSHCFLINKCLGTKNLFSILAVFLQSSLQALYCYIFRWHLLNIGLYCLPYFKILILTMSKINCGLAPSIKLIITTNFLSNWPSSPFNRNFDNLLCLRFTVKVLQCFPLNWSQQYQFCTWQLYGEQ